MAEIETQLEIAYRLKFIKDTPEVVEKIIYIRRMILKLIQSLKE